MARKIYQFQAISQENLDNDALLGVIGDPFTGLLYKPTVAQLKELFKSLPVSTDDDITDYIVTSGLAAPPASPAEGESFRILPSPTGAWAGHAEQVAKNVTGSWEYAIAENGQYLFQINDSKSFKMVNSVWTPSPGIPILNNGNIISNGVTIGTNNNRDLWLESNKKKRMMVKRDGTIHMFASGATTVNIIPDFTNVTGLNDFTLTGNFDGAASDQLAFLVTSNGVPFDVSAGSFYYLIPSEILLVLPSATPNFNPMGTWSGSLVGAVTNNIYFVVFVDGNNGSVDTFAWRRYNASGGLVNQGNSIPITGAAQLLANGISFTFGSTTGHTINDDTQGYVIPVPSIDTYTYGYVSEAPVPPAIFPASQVNKRMAVTPASVRNGLSITFGAITGHTINDAWGYNINVTPNSELLSLHEGANDTTDTVFGFNSNGQAILNKVPYQFPASDGTAGQAITTDGAGNLNWSTVGGGGGGVDNLQEAYDESLADGSTTYQISTLAANQVGFRGGLVKLEGTATSGFAIILTRPTVSGRTGAIELGSFSGPKMRCSDSTIAAGTCYVDCNSSDLSVRFNSPTNWYWFNELGYNFPTVMADGFLKNTGAALTWENPEPDIPLIGYYTYKDVTAAADPSTGNYRFNSLTPASITQIYISQVSNKGTDATRYFERLTTDDVLYIQDQDDSTKNIRFNISGALTDNGSWWTIPVTYVGHSGVSIINNNPCLILAYLNSGSGGGGITYAFENGLTELPAGTVKLGGVLDEATELLAGSNTFRISGSAPIGLFEGLIKFASSGGGTSNPTLKIEGDQSNTGAISVNNSNAGTGASAIIGGSNNGTGVAGSAGGSGIGIAGHSSTGLAARFSKGTLTGGSVVAMLEMRDSGALPTLDNTGYSIDLRLNSSTTAAQIANQLITKFTTIAHSTRTSEFSITGVENGSLAALLTLAGAGQITFNKGLRDFANDAAAAAGSPAIPVNGLYRNGSVVMIRVS